MTRHPSLVNGNHWLVEQEHNGESFFMKMMFVDTDMTLESSDLVNTLERARK